MLAAQNQEAARRARPVPLPWLAAPVLAVAALVALALFDLLSTSPGGAPAWVGPGRASVGAPAPDFHTLDLAGAPVSLGALRGRPVLVTFWATWCSACRDELPGLQAEADREGAGAPAVIAVNFRETDRAALGRYLSGLGVHLRPALDGEGRIAGAYQVLGLPTSVLVDPGGRVAYVRVGELTAADLRAALRSLAP